jgi:hypothetical protein
MFVGARVQGRRSRLQKVGTVVQLAKENVDDGKKKERQEKVRLGVNRARQE